MGHETATLQEEMKVKPLLIYTLDKKKLSKH